MTFRKTDGRYNVSGQLVLFQQPGTAEVPPFGAVEHEVKARLDSLPGLLRSASQGFRAERDVWMTALDGLDQSLPDLRWNLVGRVTAKTGEPELDEVLHDTTAKPKQGPLN